jgi:hypothetical protein
MRMTLGTETEGQRLTVIVDCLNHLNVETAKCVPQTSLDARRWQPPDFGRRCSDHSNVLQHRNAALTVFVTLLSQLAAVLQRTIKKGDNLDVSALKSAHQQLTKLQRTIPLTTAGPVRIVATIPSVHALLHVERNPKFPNYRIRVELVLVAGSCYQKVLRFSSISIYIVLLSDFDLPFNCCMANCWPIFIRSTGHAAPSIFSINADMSEIIFASPTGYVTTTRPIKDKFMGLEVVQTEGIIV